MMDAISATIFDGVRVLGACWGTEELGWNERSREEITRREITIKWI
jgi:hypothetical protein